MALRKYRIGDLISVIDERNNLGLRNFSGININKEFMPTVADTEVERTQRPDYPTATMTDISLPNPHATNKAAEERYYI